MKDLSKLLQNLIGETFYCTILGYVTLYKIHDSEETDFVLQFKDRSGNNIALTKEGKMYNIEESECIIFPSKHDRNWNDFSPKLPLDTPVMLYDGLGNWTLRYSAGDLNTVYEGSKKSKDNARKRKYPANHVVPVKDFNFENPNEHLNK